MLILRITNKHLTEYNCKKCWELIEDLYPGLFNEDSELPIHMNLALGRNFEIESQIWRDEIREHTCPFNLSWVTNTKTSYGMLNEWAKLWDSKAE